MRVLTFTTLYPNNVRQRHGIFVENRVRKISATEQVTVVAPVPLAPVSIFDNKWKRFTDVKPFEERNGLTIFHPRFLTIPKVGMSVAPFLLAISTYRFVRRRAVSPHTDFQLIDAHYVYPDGVAAVILGKVLRKPVVVTARGTDINSISAYRVPRFLIRWSLRNAAHVFSVSEALRQKMIELGVDSENISTVRNGVDSALFYPDKSGDKLRRELDVKDKLILSVGNLVALKGHDLVIDAIEKMSHVSLVIIGEGVEYSRLQEQIEIKALTNRVSIVPSLQQAELRQFYNAADLLVLASSREGLPNVLLEAMACGTRVVSTSVGGAPEVVTSAHAGVLVMRSVDDIRNGIEEQLDSNIPRENTVRHSHQFDANLSVKKCLTIMRDIVGENNNHDNQLS